MLTKLRNVATCRTQPRYMKSETSSLTFIERDDLNVRHNKFRNFVSGDNFGIFVRRTELWTSILSWWERREGFEPDIVA